MGYTNYWTPATNVTEEQKEKMAKFADVTIKLSPVLIKGWDGKGRAKRTKERISLNGSRVKGEDHESFVLLEDEAWAFCKTARKPYDEVVKALLIYAEEIGVITGWSFDGHKTEAEYKIGEELYKKALAKIK